MLVVIVAGDGWPQRPKDPGVRVRTVSPLRGSNKIFRFTQDSAALRPGLHRRPSGARFLEYVRRLLYEGNCQADT